MDQNLNMSRPPRTVQELLLVCTAVSGMLLAVECRLSDSLDDFSRGGPTAGFGGGGYGGESTDGGIQCEKYPVRCDEFAGDSARLMGCCEDNTHWWCERVQGDWRLRSKDCGSNAGCGYDANTGALRCISGQGGSGGGETGGTGGETGGTGGTTGGTGGSGGCSPECDAKLEECGIHGYCVAKSVPMPGGYSIDATEVTRSQYEAWFLTNPSTAGQPAACSSWNKTYQPDLACMNSDRVYKGPNSGNHPVVCVDWCDAYAYCKGVGKRLCGKIGGGANDYGDFTDVSKSQWYAACSSGGKYEFPYGATYDGQACNSSHKELGTTSEVGSLSSCQSSASGYEGVYDLSGNVWEWEDSCNGTNGISDYCRVRGGAFDLYGNHLGCGNDGRYVRGGSESFLPSAGIRCCSLP